MKISNLRTLGSLDRCLGGAIRNEYWPSARRLLAQAGVALRGIEDHDDDWHDFRGRFMGHYEAVQKAPPPHEDPWLNPPADEEET